MLGCNQNKPSKDSLPSGTGGRDSCVWEGDGICGAAPRLVSEE